MSPVPGGADGLLGRLVCLDEDGLLTADALEEAGTPAESRQLEDEGAIVRNSGRVALTEEGRTRGRSVVRGRRLSEVLALAVVAVDDPPLRRPACGDVPALQAAVTDAVCAFLGHPRFCPHGRPIPRGSCCDAATAPGAPVVEPLARIAPDAEVEFLYAVLYDRAGQGRLAALGLVPGARLRVQQVSPAVVVRVGHTTVALETSVAERIHVRRLDGARGPHEEPSR